LIAERQKGNVYYRCQTKHCPQKCVREETVETRLSKIYEKLQFTGDEYECLKAEAAEYLKDEPQRGEELKKQMVMELAQTDIRLAKLADAYVDEVFDKETYFIKKNELLLKQQGIKEKLAQKNGVAADTHTELNKFLELVNSVCLSYETGDEEQKREMAQITVSNFYAEGKTVLIKLNIPFQIIAERPRFPAGSPQLATARTFEILFKRFFSYFKAIDVNE
jgi:site-specific DNA recombinase